MATAWSLSIPCWRRSAALAPLVLGLNVPVYDAQVCYQQVRGSWASP